MLRPVWKYSPGLRLAMQRSFHSAPVLRESVKQVQAPFKHPSACLPLPYRPHATPIYVFTSTSESLHHVSASASLFISLLASLCPSVAQSACTRRPGCSSSSATMPPILAYGQLPFISYSATNASLSDTKLYPWFLRTVHCDIGVCSDDLCHADAPLIYVLRVLIMFRLPRSPFWFSICLLCSDELCHSGAPLMTVSASLANHCFTQCCLLLAFVSPLIPICAD